MKRMTILGEAQQNEHQDGSPPGLPASADRAGKEVPERSFVLTHVTVSAGAKILKKFKKPPGNEFRIPGEERLTRHSCQRGHDQAN